MAMTPCGDVAPAHHGGGGFEVGQARIGAGADEHAIDRQAGERHARACRPM